MHSRWPLAVLLLSFTSLWILIAVLNGVDLFVALVGSVLIVVVGVGGYNSV